jgi:uncharacterized protein YfaP (DUF2135 family)
LANLGRGHLIGKETLNALPELFLIVGEYKRHDFSLKLDAPMLPWRKSRGIERSYREDSDLR